MNFAVLLSTLNQPYSSDACRSILHHSAIIFREDLPGRWFFLFLNRLVVYLIDDPGFIEADRVDAVWAVLTGEARVAIEAIASGNQSALSRAADNMSEAFCGVL
jgi:hypothetical protein